MLLFKRSPVRSVSGGPVLLSLAGSIGTGAGLRSVVTPAGYNLQGMPRRYVTYKAGPNGIATATTDTDAIFNGGDVTFFVLAHLTSVSPDAVAIGRGRYNASANYASWLRFNGSTLEHDRGYGDARWEFAGVSSAITTGLNSYAVASTGTTALASGGAVFYKNGRPLTSTTTSGTTAFGGNVFDGQLDVGQGTASGATAVTAAIGGQILIGYHWNRVLSAREIASLHDNPYQLLAPKSIWVPVSVSSGPATHTTTGALAADAATVSGTALHPHTTSGALSAQSATVSGTALHPHTSTGSLSAQSATITGTAGHITIHTTTGALVADAATVSGEASGSAITGVGSYPSKKRYIVKVGNKFIITNSAAQAVKLTEKQAEKKEDAEGTQETPAEEAAETTEDVEEIPVQSVRDIAAYYGMQRSLAPLFQQRDYEGVIALYNLLKQREDEEEIELLLMAI